MARVLRVLNLKIRTLRGWQAHEYDLDGQVVVIHGPADTGKSSILDAIGFAMGIQDVQFRGAVHSNLREVELAIRLANRSYTLRRSRSASSRVEVTDEVGDLVGRFSVGERRAGTTTMSDWLLKELGLDDEFAALGPKSTFHSAVWPYLHRNQFDIDRHIVLPSTSNRLRLDALQAMTGITDVHLARRRLELENIDRETARRQRRCAGIAQFLADSQATDPPAVRAALVALGAQEVSTAARLHALRSSTNAALDNTEEWRQRRRAATDAVSEAEKNLLRVQRQRIEYDQDREKIEVSLQALSVLEAADPADRNTLGLVVERSCFECGADLLDSPPPPGHCSLCRRPLKGHQHLQTRIRLQQQLQEANLHLPELEEAEYLARLTVERCHADLIALLAEQNAQTEHLVAPHVDAIAAAAAELAAVRQRLTDLREVDGALRRLDDEQQAINSLRDDQRTRHAELAAEEEPTQVYREFVAETLTDIFRDTIADIGLPNSTGLARIDADSLLPIVDEQTFEARGGGARIGVSVAYSLTLLSFTAQVDQSGIPGLLMIDSPQKNLGRNVKDQDLARRVYQRFIDALRVRGTIGDGRFERPIQLIIVDNDKPTVDGVNLLHTLDYDDGFIKELDSPHEIADGDVPLPFETEGRDDDY